MASISISPDELIPVIRAVVAEVMGELQPLQRGGGKLAYSEAEAADLIGLNAWQLRDLRLSGKVTFSRIVGEKVRYTVADLAAYLAGGRNGTANGAAEKKKARNRTR